MPPTKTSKAAPEPETQVKAEATVAPDPTLVKEIEAAQAAQTHRKRAIAPEGVKVAAPGAMDDLKELIKYYRGIGAIPEGAHVYTGSSKPQDRRMDIAKGYIPVVDPTTNTQPMYEGDYIYHIDEAIYNDHLSRAAHMSDERLNKADVEVAADDELDNLTQERVTVSKEDGDSVLKS